MLHNNPICDFKYLFQFFSSPLIQYIKSQCAVSFENYDQCLERNPTNVEACQSQLEAFADCAEKVTNDKKGGDIYSIIMSPTTLPPFGRGGGGLRASKFMRVSLCLCHFVYTIFPTVFC